MCIIIIISLFISFSFHSQYDTIIHKTELDILPCDMKIWATHPSIAADADASSPQQFIITQTTFLHTVT